MMAYSELVPCYAKSRRGFCREMRAWTTARGLEPGGPPLRVIGPNVRAGEPGPLGKARRADRANRRIRRVGAVPAARARWLCPTRTD